VRSKTQTFNYQGPPGYLQSWLSEDADFLALRRSDGYRILAEISLWPSPANRHGAPPICRTRMIDLKSRSK
jgi:hypothetical protein